MRHITEPEQKALEINLNDKIYGTFAEIGAGQEVARYFFQAGAAAGTIAKTMSAYDKIYSDQIYGPENKGRYVCESRIYKMLDHEYDLMVERLQHTKLGTNFFVFADTVAALNYHRTIKGDGWLGIRFQLGPEDPPNDIVMHVKMLDNDNLLQQQAIGILGVNLIYACYHYQDDAEMIIESLNDNLQGRIKVDMIRITGPHFPNLDNRWLGLMLLKHNLSDIAMFGPDGKNLHASEFLYRKNILIVQGDYSPLTLYKKDLIDAAWEEFTKDEKVEKDKSFLLAELQYKDLCKGNDPDEQDFLDRADVLCSMGLTTILSNCKKEHKIVEYLNDFKVPHVGLAFTADTITELINELYELHREDRLLAAFGELFVKNVKFLVYPSSINGNGRLRKCENLAIPDEIKFLVQHLIEHNQIADIKSLQSKHININCRKVVEHIQADSGQWESMVPEEVATLIKEKSLFGFASQKMEFEI